MTDPTKHEAHDRPRDPDSVIFLRSPRAQTCPLPWRSAQAVVLGSEGWEDRLRAEPDRLLVAWGGDGTLHAAARFARPCALVAAGTGDDVAADLGLPRGVTAGLHSLQASARWCSLPMSEVTVTCGKHQQVHPMVNALSIGLGGAAAARLGPFRWCGPLAYPLAAVRALASSGPKRPLTSTDVVDESSNVTMVAPFSLVVAVSQSLASDSSSSPWATMTRLSVGLADVSLATLVMVAPFQASAQSGKGFCLAAGFGLLSASVGAFLKRSAQSLGLSLKASVGSCAA